MKVIVTTANFYETTSKVSDFLQSPKRLKVPTMARKQAKVLANRAANLYFSSKINDKERLGQATKDLQTCINIITKYGF